MSPKISLETDRNHNKQRQQSKERTVLLLILLTLVAIAIFGLFYSQQYLGQQDQPAKVDPVQQQLQSNCDRKLQQYLEQGGVDIKQKILYGDLQGCRFSSASERQIDAKASKSSQFRME